MDGKRIGILTEGELLTLKAKMAHGVMRYRKDVEAVIDKSCSGGNVRKLLPYVNKNIPVVADLQEAIELGINELLIGVAPPGGGLPPQWMNIIEEALASGIRVANGLHIRLAEEERFKKYKNNIFDIRYSYVPKEVAHGRAAKLKKNVILTVGSDCASGKMTTALELHQCCKKRGMKSDFIPTGQTGMYIMDNGFAIDTVLSDFMAGAIEDFVCEAAIRNDFVFVEGQGSLIHPAYSGVSLGLMHGSAPNIIVFAHDITRERLAYFDKAIPTLEEQIEITERLAGYQRSCKVLGISLFAAGMERNAVEEVICEMECKYGIPVFAPLVTGCDRFVDILEDYR
ncbi:putative NAD-dependent epimerase/dehydratase family protein [Ruminiclostridium sufflavum DSM 19573]|uniref:Putative NAD-dependent epimerase/dehydratase family protein n=1 Tax=Ruminiclostridium sufflavum DSM 19573 TaxID=1121337 RepID=A0A318YC89_9FIRM|nr:DUF1611 domain-containing protein [Ruminiclostridium sufflavum]PYG90232.1 putative NAD-dependent epimerase/dehydratase family protein [Ruminiclostridium sufflavum DSM 19573]